MNVCQHVLTQRGRPISVDSGVMQSARKHGIAEEDMLHAVRYPIAVVPGSNDVALYLGQHAMVPCSRWAWSSATTFASCTR